MTARTIEYLALDDIVPAQRNPKRHDLDTLAASVKRFGVIEPAVVDGRTGRLVSGHGRTETYQLLQQAETADLDPPDGVVVGKDGRWQVPVVTGWSSSDDQEAEAALVALNRIGEGMWDQQSLAELLKGLDGEEAFVGTGFDLDDLGQLLDALDAAEATEADKADPPFAREQIVERAFAHYRERGFPFRRIPVHEAMQEINRLAGADEEGLVQSGVGGPVADNYHPHRHAVRVGGVRSPADSFADDDQLRHAFGFCLEHMSGITDTGLLQALRFVRGSQAASNFRPAFALWVYRRYGGAGATVLDCSTGFGGRLVGFLASPCKRYVGIDPSTPTYEGNLRLASDLCPADKDVQLLHAPAEDVKPDDVGEVDLAFTSPPYFAKEHYSDEGTQSWVRYKDGEAWRAGFLLPMMQLQAEALRPGRHAIVNIADIELGGTSYPLVAWTMEAAKEVGMEFERQDRYPLKRVPGAGDRPDRHEPVLVFRKP